MNDDDNPQCNKAGNRNSPCAGDVGYWIRPSDGKMFLKCERHVEIAEWNHKHAAGLMSPLRASWFDPMAAGERWEDDY